VPNSVLWLYKHPKSAVQRLLREAMVRGIVPERFIFSGPVCPKEDHLSRLTLADVYLDTLAYNGHTTGSDALWAAVPMVTLQGKTWASRVGASLANAVECPEMIVHNLDDYVARAVKLATNASFYKAEKTKLMAKRDTAPLFDTERWVRSFEKGLDKMWRVYYQGLPRPDAMTLEDFSACPADRDALEQGR